VTNTADRDEPAGYAAALAELEGILESLDGDDVDIDRLSSDVRRAAELISICRDRLTATRAEVERIVADLDPDGTGSDNTGSDNTGSDNTGSDG